MKKCLIFIFMLIATSVIMAQDSQEVKSEPATKVEVFLAKRGQLLIKDYYLLGIIIPNMNWLGLKTSPENWQKSEIAKSRGYSNTEFSALIITVPDAEKEIIKGLRITVRQTEKYEKSSISFLDMEEIESLSLAIKYMDTLSLEWEAKEKEYKELVFRTKGDFSAGFYQKGVNQTFFVSSGHIGAVHCFLSKKEFFSMKKIVDDALKLLQEKG